MATRRARRARRWSRWTPRGALRPRPPSAADPARPRVPAGQRASPPRCDGGVVPALDEVEDGLAGLGPRAESPAIEELAFEGGEEGLRRGVVVGVAHASH